MTQTDYILTARGLHKTFGRGSAAVHVLRGLNLSVRRGEFLAVMGPSGCGKSTLLHVLGLMTPPDSGEIAIDGKVAAGPADRTKILRTKIGFVFQRFNLIDVLSARDNVSVSLRVRGLSMNGHVDAIFEALGVSHVARRKPGQMSIGEQQRVALVRAIAHQPAILLADEPTGNLDSASSTALLSLLSDIHRGRGQTIVMITHSTEAAGVADRVVHMRDGVIFDANE